MSHEPEMDFAALPEEKLAEVTGGSAGRTWYPHPQTGFAYAAMRFTDRCSCGSYHCLYCNTTGKRHHPRCTMPTAPLEVCESCIYAERYTSDTCMCRAQRLEQFDHVYD